MSAAVLARSGDWITAGDGLGAFGAALILAVQAHYGAGKATVLQWIWAGVSDPRLPQMSKKEGQQIEPQVTIGRAAARASPGEHPGHATDLSAQPPQPRESGPARHLPSPAPERRAAAAGRCTPRRSRGTLKDGRCRLERLTSEANHLNAVLSPPGGAASAWRPLCRQPGSQALGSVRRTPFWPWLPCSCGSLGDQG